MTGKNSKTNAGKSRRDFLKNSSLAATAGVVASSLVTPKLSIARSAHAFGSDTIKIGLVGCGGRGRGAAGNAMNTEGNVELTAMGDVFEDRLKQTQEALTVNHGEKVRVPKDQQFVGFDAYKKVLESDINLVILTTPPGFRPLHFEAAVEAGKHVFMEKPVAVDAPGIRRVLKAGEVAKKKELAVGVGLQRRHERFYQDVLGRIKDGMIGDLIMSRAYWNGQTPWCNNRKEEWTELEYQMRNWYFFNWICGDHIVEQHIHNLDVINWLMDDFPVRAQGQGGRLVRNGKDHGQIFDHHMIEFTYANGHKMYSQCRHMQNTWTSVSEHVHGSEGYCNLSGGRIFNKAGKEVYKSAGNDRNKGHQVEHHDLFKDLRNGIIPNETEYGAKSTMTAIFGRLATYTGKEILWEDAINSDIKLADVDSMKSLEDKPPIEPDKDGNYPIPQPGINTKDYIDWEPGAKKKKKK